MRRISFLAIVLALTTAGVAQTISELNTSASAVNTTALENLVYLSASNQGRWPEVALGNANDTQKAAVLKNTLETVAIAQQFALDHGEKILEDLKNSECCSCELRYNYAKFSGCRAALRKLLLEAILIENADKCEGLIKGLAAWELLKRENYASAEEKARYIKTLSDELLSYKAKQVSINTYWRTLVEIADLLKEDEALKDSIESQFPDELVTDLIVATKEYEVNPNYYGTYLTYRDIYPVVSKSVREYWCKMWDCGALGRQ